MDPSKPVKCLFDTPSKYGVHHAISTYTPTERRFQWQQSTNATDALYTLPSSVGAGQKKSFGTSTRADWDTSQKRANPCAGPGSYRPVSACGTQPISPKRTAPVIGFSNAPRSDSQSNATLSPGPVYDLPASINPDRSSVFGTSVRPPLSMTTNSPGPNIALKGSFKDSREHVNTTFGTEKRLRPSGGSVGGRAPGPIYELDCTGFRTGPTSSFSHAKRF